MKGEIQSAVVFVSNLLRGLTNDQRLRFNDSLAEVLASHYTDHWFPEKPCRGSAYRCIRVNQTRMDPLLSTAVSLAELTDDLPLKHFPKELTIWIDPNEVSYRFGEDGSIGVIFEERDCATSTGAVEPPSIMQGLYDSCRRQVHDLLQSTASRGSDLPVNLDCLRSCVMV